MLTSVARNLSKVRIAQFTDLHHYSDDSASDKSGLELIGTILDRTKPDLVVFTGDILDGKNIKNVDALKTVTKTAVDRQIPWVYVPGNHDDESPYYTRRDLFNVAINEPYCLTKDSKTFDSTIQFGPVQLYFIDSNAYAPNNNPHTVLEHTKYDWIHDDQIEWYKGQQIVGEVGLAFYHIPVPEYKISKMLNGEKGEHVCAPVHNSGFFEALVKKGDIQAMFVGHDHLNDYVSELDNIWLCYGRVTGFTEPAYYAEEIHLTNLKRGGRIIEYDSTTKQLSTWIETMDGKVESSFISRQFTRPVNN